MTHPPNINKWVGRSNELKSLSSKDFKVTFITGIGGQGKSALASYYIKHIVENDRLWELWDWRDCKEEDNRFHTMIISIIERITRGRIRSNQLINESINSLIEIVFEQLGSKKIVFVFDNIDKYIDLVNFVPSRGISILFEKALNREHSSKFIFTCRPAILYSHSDLLQLEIEGLNIDNTIEIFNKYKIPVVSG